jgi:hypothetical protein
MHKLLLSLVLILSLIGCSENQDILSYPKNIRYNDEYVLWDEVEGAISYTIKINENTYDVTSPSFNINGLPNGTYDIRVRSQKDESISYYSPVLNITIDRTFQSFNYVALIDGMISWPVIPGVSTYEIYHGEELIASTIYNSVDLTSIHLEENKLYHLHVVGKYPSEDVVYSDSVIYHTYSNLNITIETTFDHSHIENLHFSLSEEFPIDYILYGQELISSSLYHYENNTLILEHDAFHPNQEGIHYIYILTSQGFVTLKINVINEMNPELYSQNTIDYLDQDLIFTFELNGGTFVGLSGYDIHLDDYTFINQELIIKSTYVERLVQENADLSTLILIYQLSKNNQVSMGFIFINIK